ncbi:hypothetical protein M8C21_020433, partial [Ambrosia artemisiifolia]
HVSNLPYGRTFFHHPTNRYSDGRLVIDFVAESLNLPYLPPYLNRKANTSAGVNYAVAGSTAIRHAFFVKNNLTFAITPQSLQTQLSWFNKTMEGLKCKSVILTPVECEAVFRDALVWVGEIGANDYAYTLGSTALLNKGAKYMVVQGLPATGCLTLAMYLSSDSDRDDMGCVATVNNQSYIHNTDLQTNIQNLRRKYPNAVLVYADYWSAYRSVIQNAPKLGFHELYKVCCGSSGGPYNFDLSAACGSKASSSCRNPSQYVNWDGVHLTEAMYKALLNKGAKYMVVQGLPMTGCLTLAMYLSPESDRDDIGCVATVNNQSHIHNTILQNNIQTLRRKYPKAVIVYADYWNAYRSVIKNAPKLGFHELYKVCCGSSGGSYNFDLTATCGSKSASSCRNPSEYVNWDGVHLTEAILNKRVDEHGAATEGKEVNITIIPKTASALNASQKEKKIKCSIKADENTKFFCGITP